VPEARETLERVPNRLARTVIVANGAGAVTVFLYLQFVAPGALSRGSAQGTGDALISAGVFVAYMLVTLFVGLRWGPPRRPPDWMMDPRAPTPAERRIVLRLPTIFAEVSMLGWIGAAVIFGALNMAFGNPAVADLRVVGGILMGGLVSAAVTYAVAEREVRPWVVLALAGRPDPTEGGASIHDRLLRAWMVGSGIPLVAIGLTPLARTGHQTTNLVLPIAFLAVVGLGVGYLLSRETAAAVSEPMRAVRRALDAVGDGDLSVEVVVDDPGEIGELQAGVNDMVVGLRERRQLEDLFGRHVGEDVARQAMEHGVALGGEQRVVSVFFVDLIGSTALAAVRPATEIVDLLNRLFGAVVRVVEREGGWVNKFEGDGALCVFGAPVEHSDHPARALRAARALRNALAAEAVERPDLDAAIGVSTGAVVAGNVGTLARYEFTVVGDAVNEAARLTDLAKGRPQRVLASRASVGHAGADEARHWSPAGAVELRGRSVPTEVMVPVVGPDPGSAAGDSRDDRQRLAVGDRGVEALEEADVLVGEEDVHEAP
jgi:adenylate cyclase